MLGESSFGLPGAGLTARKLVLITFSLKSADVGDNNAAGALVRGDAGFAGSDALDAVEACNSSSVSLRASRSSSSSSNRS